jgi:hypothetical protein
MMPTPHERAVSNAGRTTDRLGRLFDALGHAQSRRGIFRAYRATLAALRGNLDDLSVTGDALAQLRRAVELEAGEVLQNALELGIEAGQRDADLYGFVVDPANDLTVPPDALAAILATVDAQTLGARGLLLLGQGDEAQIIGNDSQAGILTPAPVTSNAARWVVLLSMVAYDVVTQRSIVRTELPAYLRDEGMRAISASAPAIFGNRFEGYDFAQFGIGARVQEVLGEWGRQVVAVVDERTTDCCLKAHGQWQAMGDDFVLTGQPRYADKMPRPPFHRWCRTATALVQRQYAADDLTVEMRAAARRELIARKTATPRRKVITPANAFSRRA